MAIVLRQSTAVDVLIGQFVDSTDGVTAETGLTISQADVQLSKNGQALAQKDDNTACAHDADGYYNCELDATDTNTVGTLVLKVSASGALPVRHEFQVITQDAYDFLYASDATPDTTVAAILTDTGTTLQAELDGIQADTEDIQSRLPAALVNGRMDSTIDGTGMEAGALAAINAEVDTALADYDPPTRAELASDKGEILTVLGTPAGADLSADIAQIYDAIDTEIAAILEDTSTTLDDLIDTEIAAIKTKTDSLTFTVAGVVDANIQRVNDVSLTGDGDATPWGPA